MTKKLSLTFFTAGILAFVPLFTFGQGQDAFNILDVILGLLNTVITVLIIAAVAFFIYAVVTYILNPDEDKKKRIINGLIGLFVIVTFWGIIRIVQNTFGVNDSNQLQPGNVPCVQGINC